VGDDRFEANVGENTGLPTFRLKTETITKGSPHTLLLIKTRAAYDRAMRHWEEDGVLLEKLNYLVTKNR